MAIQIRFDLSNNPLPSRLILATKSGNRIRELPVNEMTFREGLTDGSEFTFKVYKNRCTNRSGEIDESFWRRITDFKLVYCPEFDMWYEIYIDLNESTETMKSVSAMSLGEAELSQVNVYEMEVNTEADIDRADYRPTVLYSQDKSISLVDRLLYKAPHYRVKHVDDSIANIQRTFQFNGKSVYDCYQEVAQEINCLVRMECCVGTDRKIDRSVSFYDLENYCLDCHRRGDFLGVCDKCGSTNIRSGYGSDTSIFVSRKNLAEEITYSTDVNSVKNCFRLVAGDDLMTATVINCNPNGSQYIWYIPEELKEDMSETLHRAIDDYQEQYELYQNSFRFTPPSALRTSYNNIVNKYVSFKPELQGQTLPSAVVGYAPLMEAYYNAVDLQLFLNSELMPNVESASTNAAAEARKLTAAAISPVAVANVASCTRDSAANAILGMAKCLVRPSFQVKANSTSYSYSSSTKKGTWKGTLTVTNYSDEEDTATTGTLTITVNDDMEKYINQKLKRLMKQQSDDVTNIEDLMALYNAANETPFTRELGKYSLQRLLAFRESCQAILDVLIQQGVADQESWASAEDNLYETMYLPYRRRMALIEAEIVTRTNELATVAGIYDTEGNLMTDGILSLLQKTREQIQKLQNFENFIKTYEDSNHNVIGDALWEEFASFRREDTYQNGNYISDGLNNEQLFARARQFLETAEKEISYAATLQHSIDAHLQNLLAMKEFQPLTEHFAVGNWIRIEVDGRVYRLRLREYTIDFDSLSLDVEFTDVRFGHSSATDIQSVLDAAKSMSSSYGAVTRQAEQGKKSNDKLKNWADYGFELTTKIVGGAENQEFVIDNSGITGRKLIPETGGYSPEQIKIISDGLYVTDDGWLTARAGIGRFTFFNPKTGKTEEAYGVIADKLVGNFMLSQEIGIYNEAGSISMDNDGFTLITEAGENAKVFRILRKEGDGSLTNILSVDAQGNLALDMTSISGYVDAAIQINNEGILQTVEDRMTQMSTSVIQRADGLEVKVNNNTNKINTTQTTFRVTSNGAEISKSGSNTVLEVSNNQIDMKVNGDIVTYWNVSEQYMPKTVRIPVGGSLQLGSIKFQPRSSGNLSVVWVG